MRLKPWALLKGGATRTTHVQKHCQLPVRNPTEAAAFIGAIWMACDHPAPPQCVAVVAAVVQRLQYACSELASVDHTAVLVWVQIRS